MEDPPNTEVIAIARVTMHDVFLARLQGWLKQPMLGVHYPTRKTITEAIEVVRKLKDDGTKIMWLIPDDGGVIEIGTEYNERIYVGREKEKR